DDVTDIIKPSRLRANRVGHGVADNARRPRAVVLDLRRHTVAYSRKLIGAEAEGPKRVEDRPLSPSIVGSRRDSRRSAALNANINSCAIRCNPCFALTGRGDLSGGRRGGSRSLTDGRHG